MNVKFIIVIICALFIFKIEIACANNSHAEDSCTCDILNLVKIQESINNLTEAELVDFLWTFDGRCKNNVEYGEFSNEVLYSLLSNKDARLLIRVLSKNNDLPLEGLKQAIENPIDDSIDLNKAYDNIKKIKRHKNIRDSILQSINIAISKYRHVI